jgi:erythromycin esterase
MKICLQTLFLFALSHLVNGQVFSNIDFEYGIYKAQPRKWRIEGEGGNYSAQLDSAIHQNGKKSLSVSMKEADVFVFLSIPRDAIAGKEIQVAGHFRSVSGDSLQAMIILHDPTGGGALNTSQAYDPNIKDWQVISHRASFPESYSSDRLLIALMATGTGQFWFDNVIIKIDDHEYGEGPPDFREPTKKEIQALDEFAVPIKILNAPPDNNDLVPLKKVVDDATVIGLGENSHGSASIYKLKLRMIKHLVENEGFSVFALECPTVEADRINEYVISGKGTIDQVIKDLIYPSWQTSEMLDIIQWMRSYNLRSKRKIQFRGFDMQNGLSALKAVEDFANIYDSTLLINVIELDTIYSLTTNEVEQWKSVIKKSEEISLYLAAKEYAGVDPNHFARIKHYMTVFHQSLPSNYKPEKRKSRDDHMADNIDWIVKTSGNNAKVIVSADNTHVTKADGKMGKSLHSWYGDKYLAVGFTYNTGSYSAYGSEKYYEVHPSFTGTYEYYFSKCKSNNFLLDLRNMRGIDILKNASGFRSIGSRPQETTQFAEIRLMDHFDVIVYLEKSAYTEMSLSR